MNDLESELQRVMRDKAAALTTVPPLPSSPARGRGRNTARRRLVMAVVSAVLLLGAAAAVVGGLILRSFQVNPISDRFVIASGETEQGPWQLTVYQARITDRTGDTTAWCLDLDGPLVGDANMPQTGSGNICSLRDAPDEPIGPLTLFPGFKGDQGLLYGQVSSEVAQLQLAVGEGQELSEVAVIPAPEESGLPVGYFATFIKASEVVEIVARNGNGEVLETERIGGDS